MSEGWIKLHRKITEWEWYGDINVCRVFMHLLIMANHKDNKWRGKLIKRGDRVTSYANLASETRLSVRQVRVALDKLKLTGEVTSQSTNEYTVITICNYDCYQSDDKPNNKRVTNEGQTNDKRMTTNKNEKNVKNEKNEKKEKPSTLQSKESEREIGEVLDLYNSLLGTGYKSMVFAKNFEYWKEVYSLEDIKRAIRNLATGKWWAKDPTPQMIFRIRNPKGENVDYIGELINLKGEKLTEAQRLYREQGGES